MSMVHDRMSVGTLKSIGLRGQGAVTAINPFPTTGDLNAHARPPGDRPAAPQAAPVVAR